MEFTRRLKLFKFATSLGGIESLIDHFVSTMRYYYPNKVDREALGFYDNMFRVSVGVENEEDLIDDMKQALESI